MDDCERALEQRLSIAAVERDTGLSKDTLRVWERRYGFPCPERDQAGDRIYPPEQVVRLHTIRRLMDAGHRPGRWRPRRCRRWPTPRRRRPWPRTQRPR